MKKILILVLCLFISKVFSQETNEIQIKSEVNEVTVFIDGAQIKRLKAVDLKQGKTILKFVNLSPFIDAKSVQVKADGDVTVLSVNHQQNFIEKSKKAPDQIDLESKLKAVENDIKLENTYLYILTQELEFLKENRQISGKNEQVNVTSLKEAAIFYSTKLSALKLSELKRKETLYQLNKQKVDIENQIKVLTDKKEFPSGEILVTVDAKKALRANFELSYLVANASWFPSYDVRAKNINEPLELVYKANVRQDTKVDWSGVKIKFSSSNPNISGVAPELKTYFLDYYTAPPVYNQTNNSVSGIVLDDQGPLPGVNVIVKGTTIGTSTDFDGHYSISIPNNLSELVFSFIGMESKTILANNPNINVTLEASNNKLEEVVVTAYGSRNKGFIEEKLQGKVAGVQIRGAASDNLANQITKVEKQTAVEFEINTPFNLKSSTKSYAVDMKGYLIDAKYQYYSVPKIDKKAFLLAQITNWEQYNLLDGEVNIFFEGAFVGKSLLDLRQVSDTMQISLGIDKQVIVNREQIKNYTTKQLIGNKKEETKAWKISIKNNKNQQINMVVFDQVPVSTLDEIKVEVQNTTGGQYNIKNGEVKWEFLLLPKNQKDFDLKYAVKYPKDKDLIIE